MKPTTLFLLLCIPLLLATTSCSKPDTVPLKVMSFNIWHGGGKSVAATAGVIVKSGADIVGIQEASHNGKNTAVHIADSLGWYAYEYSAGWTIMSRYPVTDTSATKLGVKIKIDDKHFVWMFNVHLIYCPYEPYQLNGIEYCGAPLLSTAAEAVASAKASRGEMVERTVQDIINVQKEGYPVFLTGDFNEPSYLDWTQRATEAGICKMPVEWPSTKTFTDKAGLKDSYRTQYPDEVTHPGHTWTPLPETSAYTEVMDRIDFVFFSGDKAELTNSQVVGENSPKSDIRFENHPSDHRAVLSSFNLK